MNVIIKSTADFTMDFMKLNSLIGSNTSQYEIENFANDLFDEIGRKKKTNEAIVKEIVSVFQATHFSTECKCRLRAEIPMQFESILVREQPEHYECQIDPCKQIYDIPKGIEFSENSIFIHVRDEFSRTEAKMHFIESTDKEHDEKILEPMNYYFLPYSKKGTFLIFHLPVWELNGRGIYSISLNKPYCVIKKYKVLLNWEKRQVVIKKIIVSKGIISYDWNKKPYSKMFDNLVLFMLGEWIQIKERMDKKMISKEPVRMKIKNIAEMRAW